MHYAEVIFTKLKFNHLLELTVKGLVYRKETLGRFGRNGTEGAVMCFGPL